MYFFINTKQDGPVVVDLPPAVPGASFYGTIEDAWYVPLEDIGLEGKGGKYLVLPPDYTGDVPAEELAVGASEMVGGYALRYALDNSAVKSVTSIGRGSLATSSGRNMSATKRPSLISSALYTAPIPLRPSFSMMR
jgi:hypothetical protein